MTYVKHSKTNKQTHYIAFEAGETTVVHSRDKQELAHLLIGWVGIRHTGISLVEFGGRRGFNIKHVPDESDRKITEVEDGSHITTAERSGVDA